VENCAEFCQITHKASEKYTHSILLLSLICAIYAVIYCIAHTQTPTIILQLIQIIILHVTLQILTWCSSTKPQACAIFMEPNRCIVVKVTGYT